MHVRAGEVKGWMQVEDIHILWDTESDKIEVQNVASGMPPMKLSRNQAVDLRRALAFALGQ